MNRFSRVWSENRNVVDVQSSDCSTWVEILGNLNELIRVAINFSLFPRSMERSMWCHPDFEADLVAVGLARF
jgi:hypothetical protein